MASSNTPSPTTRFGIFVLIAGVTLVFVFWGILRYLSDARHHATGGEKGSSPVANSTVAPKPAATPDPADAERAAAMARLNERISQALSVLHDPANQNKKQALDALREALRGEDPKVAAAVIRQFLDSKQDAKTGLPFALGKNHSLESAPTFRTFLMDELGNISQSAKLADAAEVARTTLQTPDSADEWAVAMRNLAQADPEGSRALLTAKAKELITNATWQQQPTGGFLQAFDVAAYAADPATIQELTTLLNSPNGALQRASQIALSRLSQLSPDQVTTYLNANPNTLSANPMLRADYMGNVDLSSPAQMAQAETYLARTDITDAEKSKFIGRLALPAGFVSDTLVTPEDIVTMPLLEHRALVNKTASAWLASGKYPTLQSALQGAVQSTTESAQIDTGAE